ncbi:hypothetical protein RJ640_015041 [Escallonia rubra]|uniref:ABC transmembrane type-1 domain-containing protein n=1 Tax=Escallonia rubra TaxID=112253 RepID=A0AA88RU79_9ASTE|nr:hypothetical protein RJ640_015041 [Escallonia rubra]
MHGLRSENAPLLNRQVGRKRDDASEIGQLTDLEHGDAVPAKPEVGNLILATIALLIASTSSILIPKFGGKIIDIVSGYLEKPEQKIEALDVVKNTIVGILTIVVVGSVCTALRAWLFSFASERVVARLRKDLFSHLIYQEIAFYDVTRTGELLSRLSEDTQIIKNGATTNISEALRNLSTVFIGLGFMFATSWKLTLGSSVSGLSGLYTVAMKAAGASRRVFQLLDRVSSMPKSGNKCPLGLVLFHMLILLVFVPGLLLLLCPYTCNNTSPLEEGLIVL